MRPTLSSLLAICKEPPFKSIALFRYRNRQGNLMLTVHRSKMTGLVLSDKRVRSSPSPAADSSSVGGNVPSTWMDSESLVPLPSESSHDGAAGLAVHESRPSDTETLGRAASTAPSLLSDDQEEESALDRLKKKGRKRKLVPPVPLVTQITHSPPLATSAARVVEGQALDSISGQS